MSYSLEVNASNANLKSSVNNNDDNHDGNRNHKATLSWYNLLRALFSPCFYFFYKHMKVLLQGLFEKSYLLVKISGRKGHPGDHR